MAFQESFANILSQSGIIVDASLVPDRQSVLSDVDTVATWLSSLEIDTKEAIDSVTADEPIKAGLADGSVGIVNSIGSILEAFDSAEASISISSATDIIRSAAESATD